MLQGHHSNIPRKCAECLLCTKLDAGEMVVNQLDPLPMLGFQSGGEIDLKTGNNQIG